MGHIVYTHLESVRVKSAPEATKERDREFQKEVLSALGVGTPLTMVRRLIIQGVSLHFSH